MDDIITQQFSCVFKNFLLCSRYKGVQSFLGYVTLVSTSLINSIYNVIEHWKRKLSVWTNQVVKFQAVQCKLLIFQSFTIFDA